MDTATTPNHRHYVINNAHQLRQPHGALEVEVPVCSYRGNHGFRGDRAHDDALDDRRLVP